MARRRRCVNCWKLFTPNYRNRTKVNARQRVCSDCGSIIGHRFADQRYRASPAAPRRAREGVRESAGARPDTPPAASAPEKKLGDVVPEAEKARQVRIHLAAIAALVEVPARRKEGGAVERPPISLGARRGPLNA